ncbi:DUF3329 domain-containing protein [Viscerimonas tarda]
MFSTVKNKLNGNIPFLVIIFVMFGFIYALNIYYPLLVDDWVYSFKFLNGERLGSFADVLEGQYKHYFEWGGRSVGHTIAQTLLWFGEGWSDVLNSIAFVVFVLVIYSIANRNTGKSQPAVLVFICLLIWFIQRHYLGECLLWVTGSGNYLWGSLIILLFLRPVCSYYLKPEDKKNGIVRSIVLFIGGILAGWTNENTSVSLVFFMLVMFFLLRRENKKIPLWAKWAFAGLVIGCAILLAAPGNYVRYNNVGSTYTPFSLYAITQLVTEFIKSGVVISIIYLAVLAFCLKFRDKQAKNRQALRLSLLFFFTALSAWVVMIASPKFPPRAWFGITSYMIVAVSLLYANMDRFLPSLKKLNYIALTLGLLPFGFTYTLSLKETIRIRKIFDQRELYVKEQKKNGIENIIIHGSFVSDPSKLVFLPKIIDLVSSDSTDWVNAAYARYNNVKSIKIMAEPEINENKK